MFESNARVEPNNGIRFYERDVLKTRKTFNSNSKIKIDVNYLSTGIGFVLIPVNKITKEEENRTYFFRIGERDYTCDLFSPSTQMRLKDGVFLSEKGNNKQILFKKENRDIKMYFEGREVFSIRINEVIEKYKIGIYSSEGNTIKEVKVSSQSPEGWKLNMINTDGGEIDFIENGLFISNCKDKAEIIQEDLLLPKGNHYIRYNKSENSDIEVFIFRQNDKRTSIKDKSILKEDNSFYLEEDTRMNVAIIGTIGSISEISISSNIDEKFVIPEINSSKSSSSDIKIDSRGLNSVFLVFEILRKNSIDDDPSFLFKGNEEEVNLEDLPELEVRRRYATVISFNENISNIKVYEQILIDGYDVFNNYNNLTPLIGLSLSVDRYLSLLSNLDSIISFLNVKTSDGKITNPITQKTSKITVPINNNAPITVYSKGEPLDLSSSYRLNLENVWPPMLTTNVEREIFPSQRTLILEKEPSSLENTIKLYGIKKGAEKKPINLLKNSSGGEITEYTKDYDVYEEEALIFSKEDRTIVFDRFFEYEEIIVDYLKNYSFCINKLKGSETYEVETSFTGESAEVIYETSPYNKKETHIAIEDQRYVVLNKFVEEEHN